jgi:hypothetical protein
VGVLRSQAREFERRMKMWFAALFAGGLCEPIAHRVSA